MIVQPDFLDHWKTLRLASVLSDPMAPVYVIRLWGYIQTRRCDLLPDDAETVKAICRWPGPPIPFCEALVSCGWLERTSVGLLAHGWSELNARLIHNWTVGITGGRPRLPDKKPKDKPKGLPNETEESRVEESRVDMNTVREQSRTVTVDKFHRVSSENYKSTLGNPSSNPVEIALEICSETKSDRMRNFLSNVRSTVGDVAFRQEIVAFAAELAAGESVKNRGAALVARLKKLGVGK